MKMQNHLRKQTLKLLTATAILSALSGCSYHDTWKAEMFLVGTTPLTDPAICARIVILNESKKGEEAYTTSQSVYKDWNTGADWVNNTATYTIFDGYLGHMRTPHSTGDLILANAAHQSKLLIEIPFDASKNPEALQNPYFEIEVALSVASMDVNSTQTFNLGFNNDRYSEKELQITATEGLCGFEYRYRALANRFTSGGPAQVTDIPADF